MAEDTKEVKTEKPVEAEPVKATVTKPVEAEPVKTTEAKPVEATKAEPVKATEAKPVEEKAIFVKKSSPFADYKMFDRWNINDVIVSDLSLVRYINLDPMIIPHSFGKNTRGRFAKTQVNIVERLVNKSMRSGQGKRKLSGRYIRGRHGCGKKLQVLQIVEDAFEIVENKTKQNPIQVLIDGLQNSAPREDVTRVKKGGVAYSVAVDVSPMKRLDEAIKNIALAGFGNSFNSKTDAANALAEELISASKGDAKSIAIKRRDEVERIAKSSR